MASQSVEHLPFLVFPSLSAEYLWKVVATESNRTISRHKLLENAVEKAERLNVQVLSMPAPQYAERATFLHAKERGSCDSWFASSDSDIGEACYSTASVGDLDSGTDKCLRC